MDIFSVAGISIVVLVISILMKKYSPEFGVFLISASVLMFLLILINHFKYILDEFNFLFKFVSINKNFHAIILKILGICIVSQFSSSICKDHGNLSLANIVILFGKISVILTSMPIFKELFEIIFVLLRKSKF